MKVFVILWLFNISSSPTTFHLPKSNSSIKKMDKQTDKQTNKQTREPLSKGDSRTGLIAFQIQPILATLASLTHFILHTSE